MRGTDGIDKHPRPANAAISTEEARRLPNADSPILPGFAVPDDAVLRDFSALTIAVTRDQMEVEQFKTKCLYGAV
jgi:hypothetical protein